VATGHTLPSRLADDRLQSAGSNLQRSCRLTGKNLGGGGGG